MIEKESRPGGTGAAPSPIAHSTDTQNAILIADPRCHARLTERSLEPIDVALTFTGLAAEMLEVAL